MGHFVLQSVRPTGRSSGHTGVIIETISVQHVEHVVSTNGQERSSHALDILGIDSGISDQHFGFSDHLVGPLFLVEIGSVTVSDGVRGHFVAVGVKVLHLRIVSPFVGDVEGGLQIIQQN